MMEWIVSRDGIGILEKKRYGRVPRPSPVLEPCAVKVTRTVLGGEGGRKAPDLPGRDKTTHLI